MGRVLDLMIVFGILGGIALLGLVSRSRWIRITAGCFHLTVAFVLFYGAVPSAMLAWTDSWPIIADNPDMGGRIRDAGIMGYHGLIVGLTFYGFAIWQRLHPVNADADEMKREAGGYR